MTDSCLFHEQQQLRQPWLWLFLSAVILVVGTAFGSAIYEQLVLDRPWGRRPISDPTLIGLGAIAIAIPIGLGALMYRLRLITEVRDSGLYLQFVPFHRGPQRIPLEDAVSIRALRYRPLREYGGWGIRLTRHGKAYNIRGDRGVRIDFANRKHLLIGSQRPEDMVTALERIRVQALVGR